MAKKVIIYRIKKKSNGSIIKKGKDGYLDFKYSEPPFVGYDDKFNVLRYNHIKAKEEELKQDRFYDQLLKTIEKYEVHSKIKDYLKELAKNMKWEIQEVERNINSDKATNYSGVLITLGEMELEYIKERLTFVKELLKCKDKIEILNNFKKLLGIIKGRIMWYGDKNKLIYLIDRLLSLKLIEKIDDKRKYLSNFIDENQRCFYNEIPKQIIWIYKESELAYLFDKLMKKKNDEGKKYVTDHRIWKNISETFVKKNGDTFSPKRLAVNWGRIKEDSSRKSHVKEKIDDLINEF